MVDVICPLGHGTAGMIEAEEQALVQQFVAHPAIETLSI